MKTKSKIVLLTLGSLALPMVTFAQELTTFTTLVNQFGKIVDLLIPIVFTLGLLFFFWGLVKYIMGDAHDQEQAKKTMLWGIIALFVMSAVWGLVAFVGKTFGVDTSKTNQGVPTVTKPS
jgi:hypothetical protein